MGKSKHPLTAGNEIEGLKPYEIGETIRKGPAYRLYQNKLYSFAGTFPFTTANFDTELTAGDWVLELGGVVSDNSHEEDTHIWNTADPKTFTVVDSSKVTDVYLNGKRLGKFLEDGTTPEEWQVNDATTIEVLIPLYDEDRITIVRSSTVTGYSPKPPYLTVQAMLDDQVNQIEHEEYTVEDASDWTGISSGWATFQKKAASTASESDYVLREKEEVNSTEYRTPKSESVNIYSATAENVDTPLVLPSYDGSDQGTHPSVVDTGENSSFEYRYYMAYTPYTDATESKENPSILGSNNKTDWFVPTGLTNPIQAAPVDGTFWADPELLLIDGTFHCYYRGHNPGITEFYLYLQTSSDGVTWSAKQLVYTDDNHILSPCIIQEKGGYVLYFCSERNEPLSTIYRIHSNTPTSWLLANKEECTINGMPANYEVWHMGITKVDGVKYCVMNARVIGQTNQNTLIFGLIEDDFNFIFPYDHFLLPETGWSGDKLYRAFILPKSTTSDEIIWDMWYSGVSSTNQWKIAYTEINSLKEVSNSEKILKESTSFSLSKKYNNKSVLMNNTVDAVITLSNYTNEPIPIGSKGNIIWYNTNKVSFVADTDVTLNKDVTEIAEIIRRYNAISWLKVGINEYLIFGGLASA